MSEYSYKFRKYDHLDGQVHVELLKDEDTFIDGSVAGISGKFKLEHEGDLQEFALAVSEAWKSHKALRKVILEKLMGVPQ